MLLVTCLFANWHLVTSRNTNGAVIKQLGFIGYATYESYTTVRTWIDERRLGFIDASPYSRFLKQHQQANDSQTQTKNLKNVIYIQLESVDGISIRGRYFGEPVMPFLNSLSQRTQYFPNTKDNTSSGRTTDGEFLTLCSLPPVYGKPVYISYPLDKVPALPRTLRSEGYYTFSMHGNEGRFWNRDRAHQQLGYDESFYEEDLDQEDMIGWGVSDESVLRQAAVKIAASEKPVFAHVILLTNHHPYNHVGHKFGYEKNELVADHVDSLRYVDRSIEQFFSLLESENMLNDCIIAIYSDHDSAIESRLREAYTNTYSSAYPDTVPLIIYGLDREPHVYDKAAGLQDLPAIILDVIGVAPPHTFLGNTLDSPNPTITPRSETLQIENGKATSKKTPIDITTLTKLAILHPEKLQ